MNLADVMDEIGDAVDTIDGLNVYRYPAHNVTAPGAVVAWPESVDYLEAYGNGMNRIPDLPVVLLVGRVNDRAAALNLAKYVDPSDDASVKAAIEGHTYTALDTAVVTSVEFDVFTMGGQEYWAAIFHCDIAGSGG